MHGSIQLDKVLLRNYLTNIAKLFVRIAQLFGCIAQLYSCATRIAQLVFRKLTGCISQLLRRILQLFLRNS